MRISETLSGFVVVAVVDDDVVVADSVVFDIVPLVVVDVVPELLEILVSDVCVAEDVVVFTVVTDVVEVVDCGDIPAYQEFFRLLKGKNSKQVFRKHH